MTRTYGWDRVEIYRAYSADEIEAMVAQVRIDHANERDESGSYIENGRKVMTLLDRQGMRKLDALTWAITYHMMDAAKTERAAS